MTILEQHLYGLILAIEAEKAGHSMVPTHTLLVTDGVLGRLSRTLGVEVTPPELDNALVQLEADGLIHCGHTIRDRYAEPLHKDFQSSI